MKINPGGTKATQKTRIIHDIYIQFWSYINKLCSETLTKYIWLYNVILHKQLWENISYIGLDLVLFLMWEETIDKQPFTFIDVVF